MDEKQGATQEGTIEGAAREIAQSEQHHLELGPGETIKTEAITAKSAADARKEMITAQLADLEKHDPPIPEQALRALRRYVSMI